MLVGGKAGNLLEGLWTPADKPHYILDWDSTLCQKETLDFVAEFTLSGRDLKRFEAFTNQGMGGSLSFSQSLAQRFSLLKVNRQQVIEAGKQLVGLLDPTAVERRKSFEKNQARIHVVSGGFEELIIPSISRLGIAPEQVHANRFVYDDQGFVIGADLSRLTSRDDGKAAQVAALDLSGLKIVVGDGFTDYRVKALGQADLFIAYVRHQSRDSVLAVADAVVDSFAKPLLT
jgi:D-3-phosphoglycerate dehydrogenase